jgi:hypothetical protein
MKLTKVIASVLLSTTAFCALSAQADTTKNDSMNHMSMMREMARYGGPVYTGAPALNVTASLVKAGGGPSDFSIATALTSMVGADAVNGEVKKLTKQYGKARVGSWITVFNFAVGDALTIATKAGVTLPEGNIQGADLAKTLVTAGLDKHHVFYTEFLLDKAVTHKIHMQVMDDIDDKYGAKADTDYHAITNQAMVDLAHALGAKQVKVAKLH